MTRKILAAIFAITLVAVTILGGIQMSGSDSTVLPVVSAVAGQAPTISKPEGTPPAELTFSDVIVGTGAEVLPTSTLTVHYTLMAWSTGQIIESSWSGQPATFPLAQVVEGWQKGLPGAKAGGRRLLILPPSMGYGASGSGPIGPNETLIFSVDIIGVA
ncbi:FkpA FKBP-type peptidyl-prolyl cis-trans isomerases 1 [Candidatus Nanopelagicaceae bacterium]|jgi:FKBP-type peptidyl-prolyl cis-trans isomerase|nr:FKBP-type peptidyl-prolyl cis-trans isomerase [Candidatus Planktophila sulfonica]